MSGSVFLLEISRIMEMGQTANANTCGHEWVIVQTHKVAKDAPISSHTFGKTKATSSNLPLLLQFSAIGDLKVHESSVHKIW